MQYTYIYIYEHICHTSWQNYMKPLFLHSKRFLIINIARKIYQTRFIPCTTRYTYIISMCMHFYNYIHKDIDMYIREPSIVIAIKVK